jgi:hypothetical protein
MSEISGASAPNWLISIPRIQLRKRERAHASPMHFQSIANASAVHIAMTEQAAQWIQ